MSIPATIFDEALNLATQWQGEISKNRDEHEQKFHNMMIKMLKDPLNKVFLIELLDQSFRLPIHNGLHNR